jgi:peptidyl-dipeptidase Dcp
MQPAPQLKDIHIRTTLQPGDIGYIIYLHGILYNSENNFGIGMEAYVAEGLAEFYHQYDPALDRVWIAEHAGKIAGFILLMHREEAAQLRYFILHPDYRGIGLGRKLMEMYMDFLLKTGYTSSYLWTVSELSVAASLYKKHGFILTEERSTEGPFGRPVIEQRYDWKR